MSDALSRETRADYGPSHQEIHYLLAVLHSLRQQHNIDPRSFVTAFTQFLSELPSPAYDRDSDVELAETTTTSSDVDSTDLSCADNDQ